MTSFEQYMQYHEIDPVRLSIEAHVRYLTVYNAQKGFPVFADNAKKIRDALFRLTGGPYDGSFVLIEQHDKLSNFQILRVKQLPKNQHHQHS